jgi:transposase
MRTGEKGGRPWRDPRDVLNAILWVLRTGAPWADLPRRYPPPQTCHRRFQKWVNEGVLDTVLRGLAEDLRTRGKLDLTEAFIDGSHAGAKRGPSCWKNSTRQGDQDHGMADRHGLPVAVGIASGERHEAKLVLQTLNARFADALLEKPHRRQGRRSDRRPPSWLRKACDDGGAEP